MGKRVARVAIVRRARSNGTAANERNDTRDRRQPRLGRSAAIESEINAGTVERIEPTGF